MSEWIEEIDAKGAHARLGVYDKRPKSAIVSRAQEQRDGYFRSQRRNFTGFPDVCAAG